MPITLDGTTGITAPAIDVATPVTTADGGTGLSSFTSGGAMYATSTSALTTGTLPVASGGTGATSLTANNVLLGNGTAALQLVAPGSSGNVLTSNGTTWTSAAAGGGALQTQLFTGPGTWTKPSSATQVRVTVIGGGGGGAQGGGPASGSTGGTSSFGPLVSATGGTGSPTSPTGTGSSGSGTISSPATSILTGKVGADLPAPSQGAAMVVHISTLLSGTLTRYGPNLSSSIPAVPYSTSGGNVAGGKGGGSDANFNLYTNSGGSGGLAVAIVPVSAPVSVTVGSGGNFGGGFTAAGGTGGAVLVEFVG